MKEKLLEKRPLANGTTLELVDASRRQAADRWVVVLEARVAIPVVADGLVTDQMSGLSLEAVHEALGSCITFVHRKERVFVPEEDKDALVDRFQNEIVANTLPYLSHPAFPARYIFKAYQEYQNQAARRPPSNSDPV